MTGASIFACPPLRTLLHIMHDDQFEGKTLGAPQIRALFTRENMLASDWYAARLAAQQAVDIRLWTRHVRALDAFLGKANYAEEAARLRIAARLRHAEDTLARVRARGYIEELRVTIGVQPFTAT